MTKNVMGVIVWLALTVVLAVWVANSAVHLKNLWNMKHYKHALLKERETLMIENSALEAELESLREYDYMKERIARFKLGLKRKGEKVIKVKNFVDNKNKDSYTATR